MKRIGSTEGIGALIIHATYNFDTGLLYASIAAARIFSVSFTAAHLLSRAPDREMVAGDAVR